MVHSSPILIKQTSEPKPIFNFEVSNDLTTPHLPALKNISLASAVTTHLFRELSYKFKDRCIFQIFSQIYLYKKRYNFGYIEAQ